MLVPNSSVHPLYKCTFQSTRNTLSATAETLLRCAGKQKVWLLVGDMGAGKTTLIRALCAQLGVQDCVSSPTFSLLHEYATVSGDAVYHFDFYRIKHEEEALHLDCMAYFESGSHCFIEWPARIVNLLPATYFEICFTVQDRDSRVLDIKSYCTGE